MADTQAEQSRELLVQQKELSPEAAQRQQQPSVEAVEEHGGIYERFHRIAAASEGQEPPPEQFSPLLQKSEFSHLVNDTQKLRMLSTLQQHYGNQYVQRVISSDVKRQKTSDQALSVQRQEKGTPHIASSLPQIEQGGGVPLDDRTQSFMGSRFGRDFSDVRVHTDSSAQKAAENLGAEAFTTGRDIYFNTGRYQTGTTEGQRLLAHELVHTIQQNPKPLSNAANPTQSRYAVSQPDDPLEREADTMSDRVISGLILPADAFSFITTGQNSLIARQHGGVPAPGGTQSQPSGQSGTGVTTTQTNPPATTPSSATEIVLPPFTLFEQEEKNKVLLDPKPKKFRLFEFPIELPPPLFLATVALDAKFGLKFELFLRYGPAVIRNIRVSLDPTSNRYTGTAQLYMPVAAGPRLTLTGSLEATLNWLALFEILAFEGGLEGIGEAPLILAFGPSVRLVYDNGTFTFSFNGQVDAGAALVFNLNAFAKARLAGDEVWAKKWHLYHWHWGRAVRVGKIISLDYIDGRLQPVRVEPYAEHISVDELLQSMKEPLRQGGVEIITPGEHPLDERLRQLLGTEGTSPESILFALAQASDAERTAVLADRAMTDSLRTAIGDALWPTAQRILNNEPSQTVPSLKEGTVFLADRHIRTGRFQDALHVVVSELQQRGIINGSLCTYAYSRETTSGEGLTTTNYDVAEDGTRTPSGPSEVEIYDPAFVNVPLLYSTIMHEYVHVLQAQRAIPAGEFTDPEAADRDEVEAYLWEIEHARGSGLIVSPDQMEELGRRLTDHFNNLSPDTQEAYQARYDAAMQTVRDAASGVLPINLTYSIEDARRQIQRASREIAELVRQRPNPVGREPTPDERREQERIDRQIAEIQQRRAEALVEVVLADNPNAQVVDPARGIYRVPVVDGQGHVQYLYGSISVVWNLNQVSPSVFSIGAHISSRRSPGVTPILGVGGTGIQGRVQPFPGDIDYVEDINVVADTPLEAGYAIADTVIEFVRRNQDREDFEFLRLMVFPAPGNQVGGNPIWPEGRILDPANRDELARQLSNVGGGNVNTFWRAWVEGEGGRRFIDITKLLSIRAMTSAGDELFSTINLAEFQVAYLEEPQEIPPASLGAYAATMRNAAIEEFDVKKRYLKAAKRAFNYFMAIGNLEAMQAVQPIFSTQQAMVNQQTAVVESVAHSLSRRLQTRILRADEAQTLIYRAADVIEQSLPPVPRERAPAEIAADLRSAATQFQGDSEGILVPNNRLSRRVEELYKETKNIMNIGIEPAVRHIIDTYVR